MVPLVGKTVSIRSPSIQDFLSSNLLKVNLQDQKFTNVDGSWMDIEGFLIEKGRVQGNSPAAVHLGGYYAFCKSLDIL